MKDTSRPESFAEVYETYFHYIYLYVLSLAKDEHLAEEITQETLVRAMEHWGTFDGNCQIQTWLCAIAKNCYYSICRKEKKMDRSRDPSSEEDIFSRGRHSAGQDAALSRQIAGGRREFQPEQALLDQETAMEIHRILHTMEEPYKEVFELHLFAELSYRQIAELFGRTEGWARTIYYRAKLKIQEALS